MSIEESHMSANEKQESPQLGQPDHLGWAVEITPAMAQAYLDTQPKNRTMRPAGVELYRRIFERGEAIAHPSMPVIIDRFGNLKDGQHRMQAIVDFGAPVTLWVVTGTSELLEAYHHSIPRKVYDTLTINHGVANASTVASIGRLVCTRLNRPLSTNSSGGQEKYTATELLGVFERYGVDVEWLATQANQLNKAQILSNKVTAAEIGYILFQRPDAVEWLTSLLTDEGSRTPSQVACRKLLAFRYPERLMRLFFVSKAYNNGALKMIKRETHVPDLIGGKFEGLDT